MSHTILKLDIPIKLIVGVRKKKNIFLSMNNAFKWRDVQRNNYKQAYTDLIKPQNRTITQIKKNYIYYL